MATLTEGARTAEFLQSEANGYRSREVQAFDSDTDWGDAAIPAGQVYAIVGGAAVAWDGDATDGSEDAAGILYEGVDALAAVDRTVIVRDAEVKRSKLTFDGTNAELDATLLALNIVVRD
jgi:hypothetical protein